MVSISTVLSDLGFRVRAFGGLRGFVLQGRRERLKSTQGQSNARPRGWKITWRRPVESLRNMMLSHSPNTLFTGFCIADEASKIGLAWILARWVLSRYRTAALFSIICGFFSASCRVITGFGLQLVQDFRCRCFQSRGFGLSSSVLRTTLGPLSNESFIMSSGVS